jgi:2-hydroxy-3-keto-5-methylthiopentenyl-1-phosphate phosphatase
MTATDVIEPAPARGGESWAVVCDFDGTAILDDIADALSQRYLGDDGWRDINRRYEHGELSFRELLHELFEPIAGTREEIRAFAQQRAHFRPGFLALLEAARRGGHRFVLVSGGLDIYIEPVLELLPPNVARDVTVYANHAEPNDGRLAISFPYGDTPDSCGTCGSCKGAIVKELQRSGHRVIAIGDGNADRCMARVADAVFARGRLRAWCDRHAVAYTPFETLDVVVDFLEASPPARGVMRGHASPSIA